MSRNNSTDSLISAKDEMNISSQLTNLTEMVTKMQAMMLKQDERLLANEQATQQLFTASENAYHETKSALEQTAEKVKEKDEKVNMIKQEVEEEKLLHLQSSPVDVDNPYFETLETEVKNTEENVEKLFGDDIMAQQKIAALELELKKRSEHYSSLESLYKSIMEKQHANHLQSQNNENLLLQKMMEERDEIDDVKKEVEEMKEHSNISNDTAQIEELKVHDDELMQNQNKLLQGKRDLNEMINTVMTRVENLETHFVARDSSANVDKYPHIIVSNVSDKDRIYENIRNFLPTLDFERKILDTIKTRSNFFALQPLNVKTIESVFHPFRFTDADTLSIRFDKMKNIQNKLSLHSDNLNEWTYVIVNFMLTATQTSTYTEGTCNYNGLICLIFQRYNFARFVTELNSRLSDYSNDILKNSNGGDFFN